VWVGFQTKFVLVDLGVLMNYTRFSAGMTIENPNQFCRILVDVPASSYRVGMFGKDCHIEMPEGETGRMGCFGGVIGTNQRVSED